MSLRRQAERQFRTLDPLQTRIETHRRYSERQTDLDAECKAAMRLIGDEAILDIGCGPGMFLSYLRQHEHHGYLCGLDQSETMIDTARQRAPELDWRVGDATKLSFSAGEFDWVVARHVLQFIDDMDTCLTGVATIIGDHGAFLAMTNGRRPWPMMWDLLQDVLSAHGIKTTDHLVRDFSIETARETLAPYFGEVQEIILDNAFVFTTPEPIADYLSTLLPSIDAAHDSGMAAALHRWMVGEAGHRLDAMGGIWRDLKPVGIYICTNAK
jgi:ubiquinone/menaquinone biosynthesis C-methylase UbiE